MNLPRTILLSLTVMFASAACRKDPATAPDGRGASAPAAAPERVHAPPGAAPGTSEDWCEEHQVPESLCTRCNAELIPAFQALGDWCAEHGLPESQCRICNPDLKLERPGSTDGRQP
ncbi:MAG: hypothetical protein HY907_12955 [Deltaproteobacteria bacterium]|nr:hypothetical protein [Deltaproteobacteria bacterium]